MGPNAVRDSLRKITVLQCTILDPSAGGANRVQRRDDARLARSSAEVKSSEWQRVVLLHHNGFLYVSQLFENVFTRPIELPPSIWLQHQWKNYHI